MMPTDVNKTRQLIDPELAMRFGGAILFIGVLLTVLTIGFEVRIGWVALISGEPSVEDLATFMQSHWSALRWIWGGQMLGTFFTALAALLLMQGLHLQHRWFSTGILWSVVFIGAILVTVAFGFTLGSYPPSIAAFEQSPELFETIRTGVRFLYDMGGLGLFSAIFVLFVWEGIANQGVMPKSWLVGTAVVVIFVIVAGISGLLAPQLAGAVIFLIQGVLGLAYWRYGRWIAVDT